MSANGTLSIDGELPTGFTFNNKTLMEICKITIQTLSCIKYGKLMWLSTNLTMLTKYSIWKTNGHSREKFLFLLSCLLLYPIFYKRRFEALAGQSIESFTLLRRNLLKIVRYRQNSVAVLYLKYHKVMPKIINELSANIIEQDINYYTFNNIELEIEGLVQLMNSNLDYNHQMTLEYTRLLTWSEQEYNNVTQAYHSHYAKIMMKMRKFPWKYLYKIFDISELELTYS